MHISKATGGECALDLTECDREPIHLSEAIQPHGVLIGFPPSDMRVSAVSANLPVPGGMVPADLLGAPLADVIDGPSLDHLAAASLRPGESLPLPRIGFRATPDDGRGWRGILHAQADGLLLEAERLQPETGRDLPVQFEQFHAAMVRLQRAEDFAATADGLVTEVRRLTGFARVMLYRFAPDWTGEVIAEARSDAMPSYLGLHFPASDIPVQARALYVRNPVRQIPDAGYQPVAVLHRRGMPIDLSPVALRSVSPLHLAYLRNMGVGASMSVSLLCDHRLWGMVACHHPTRLAVPPEPITFCSLLAECALARFGLIEAAVAARGDVAVKTLEARLLQQAAAREDKSAALLQSGLLLDNQEALLGLLGASGLALAAGGSVITLGEVPAAAALQDLLAWLAEGEAKTRAITHLAAVYPAAASCGGAAGILAVPLSQGDQDIIIWFRPERTRTVTWAGDPTKPAASLEGEIRLTPRQSFAAWTEQVRGQAHPWSAADIATANSLRDTLMEVIARRVTLIQRMNQQLMLSNEALEAFAYVASHDLKEPLRQIEIFGSLLQRAFGRQGDAPEKVERWFAGISASAQRLRGLIDHLAQYSRLGSEARPFAPADLGVLLAEVLEDFSGQMAACGCIMDIGALPVIACDAIQMRQVLQNLIGNALKYRDAARPPRIRVDAALTTSAGEEMRQVTLRVEDNGIGFDPRHQELIFKPFERLHGNEAYEGNGLGLAICRKVIDRHGGTITASSRPGEGSVFIVTLPQGLPPP
jgi:light-regulated signal transduction histidine kinase (bacteriophytochrome)